MKEILELIESAGSIDDLSDILCVLATLVREMRFRPRENTKKLQQALACLTRMKLSLREFERKELWAQGASRTLADKFAEIECAIRELSDELNRLILFLPHSNEGDVTASGCR